MCLFPWRRDRSNYAVVIIKKNRNPIRLVTSRQQTLSLDPQQIICPGFTRVWLRITLAEMAATNRRISLQNVRLPGNLLKDIDIERMGKLSEDEGSFMEFLDGLDLEDVRRRPRGERGVNRDVL